MPGGDIESVIMFRYLRVNVLEPVFEDKTQVWPRRWG